MTDLKNYDKAIRVHSQEELDECYRLFTEAGAAVDELNRDLPIVRDITYFARQKDDVWGGIHYFTNKNPDETIEYKDFRKELDND